MSRRIRYDRHARRRMRWRGISETEVEQTVMEPDRLEASIRDRTNAFKRIGDRLIRVTFAETGDAILIITVVDRTDCGTAAMQIEYSPDIDALYVYLKTVDVACTVEPNDGIAVDYDASGKVVGVEILDASMRFGSSDSALMLKDSGPEYTKDQSRRIRSILSSYITTPLLVEDDVD